MEDVPCCNQFCHPFLITGPGHRSFQRTTLKRLMLPRKKTQNGGGWCPVAWNTVTKPIIDGGLGVRDANIENQASPTHLVWRPLTQDKAWWAKIPAQKYLRQSLDRCTIKKGDSKTWKAILTYKNTIFINQKWVIGTGANVQALTDEWVPRVGRLGEHLLCTADTIVTSAQPSLPNLSFMRVEELTQITQSGLSWNKGLLQALWPEEAVHEILKIPLRRQDLRYQRDKPAGSCRFRTLYKHLLPRPMGPALPWSLVWKMNIPHRLQLFFWRLLIDRLPTRARLAKWNSAIDPLCPICRRENETVDHIFASFLDLLPNSLQKPSTSTSIAFWFWNLALESDRRVGISLCWYLWKNRNHYIFQYNPVKPLYVLTKTVNSLLEWNLSHLYAGPGSNLAASPDWSIPPPPGWLKLNFDDSFKNDTGKAGIGGLIRDPYGNMIMAYAAEVCVKHPLETELLALQRGISHANEMDASAIQIEGDCLALITRIQNSAHLSWDLMPLWQRTMHMLTSLNTWSINYCKRTANTVTDLLAKYDLPNVTEERASLPPHIRAALNEDEERAFNHPPDTQASPSTQESINSNADNPQGGQASNNPGEDVYLLPKNMSSLWMTSSQNYLAAEPVLLGIQCCYVWFAFGYLCKPEVIPQAYAVFHL